MPKQTQTETQATTPARKPVRRYTLDRTQREFLTQTVLPSYMRQLTEHADNMRAVAEQGGVPNLITADAAKMIAIDYDMRSSRVEEIVAQLGGSDDDSQTEADL